MIHTVFKIFYMVLIIFLAEYTVFKVITLKKLGSYHILNNTKIENLCKRLSVFATLATLFSPPGMMAKAYCSESI